MRSAMIVALQLLLVTSLIAAPKLSQQEEAAKAAASAVKTVEVTPGKLEAEVRPNLPFTWGAQPHNGFIFFNDINTGLWIVKLGKAKEKGSTTEPGQ